MSAVVRAAAAPVSGPGGRGSGAGVRAAGQFCLSGSHGRTDDPACRSASGHGVMLTRVKLSADSSRRVVADSRHAHAAILDRLREQPGVTSAGSTPSCRWTMAGAVRSSRRPAAGAEEEGRRRNTIRLAKATLKRWEPGCSMGGSSRRRTPPPPKLVVLNETAAKRYFRGESRWDAKCSRWSSQVGPLGRNLTWQVVADGHRIQPHPCRRRHRGHSECGAGRAGGTCGVLYDQTVSVRHCEVAIAARHGHGIARDAHRPQSVSPGTPLGTVETWRDQFNGRTAEPRLLMTTLTAFGALAAFLAALGVYGLFSWSVALRQRELAIRLTLGARPSSVSVLVRQTSCSGPRSRRRMALVQAAQGVLTTVLFGVAPNDMASTVTAAVLCSWPR